MKETIKKLVNSRNWEDFLVGMEFLKGKNRVELATLLDTTYYTYSPLHISTGVNHPNHPNVFRIKLSTKVYILAYHHTVFVTSKDYEPNKIHLDLTKDI